MNPSEGDTPAGVKADRLPGKLEDCQVGSEEVTEVTGQVAEKDIADTLAFAGRAGLLVGPDSGRIVIADFHPIVFPSEEDRAPFVFLTDRIFSGVHYEAYIFQAVSKLILC